MALSLLAPIALLGAAVRICQCEHGTAGRLLTAPLLATALLELFDLCAVSGFAPGIPWKSCTPLIEALLPPLWLHASLTHARHKEANGLGRWGRVMLGGSSLLVLVPAILPSGALFYAPDFPVERVLFLTNAGYFFYLGILVFLVIALTNLEATLVNASQDALWRMKLGTVALGSMLAVLVFYYSHALLYRTLNMALVPVRSLLFTVAAVMLVYAHTNWRGEARVKVSHALLLRSAVLAVISGYLLLLGALGEGMKYFGPRFPRVLALSLAFLTGVMLLLVLLSERFKREIKVFLHKNFCRSKYDYRAQWLGLTERLATFESGEELLKRVLLAYCDIFGVKGSALFLHEEGCGWLCATSVREMDEVRETIADGNSLLNYLRQQRRVFCCRDFNPEIRKENHEFIEKHRISFVIPLFESDLLSGFIVLGEQVVQNEHYHYEDFDLMKTIARQVSIAIQHQRLSEELARAKTMEAVANLVTFVMHDLKNLAATILLIVDNAQEHLDNPEFQKDMLSGLGNTAQKMQGLIGRLRNLGACDLFQLRQVDLLPLVERSARMVPEGTVTVQGSHQSALADEQGLQKVLQNLFLNGIEASPQGAPILAEVGFDGAPYIRVTDRGCGMSPRFLRSELFAPFHTTKPKGLGIGLYQSRQVVVAQGGKMEVSSVEGNGSVFTVWLRAPGS